MSEIDVQIKEVKASLKEVGDNLKQYYDDTQSEIKKNGEMSAELKLEIDKSLLQQTELQGQMTELEQVVAKLDGQGGVPGKPKTLGQRFVEHEDFGEPAKLTQKPGSIGVTIKDAPYNVVTSDDASAGTLIDPYRRPDIIPLPERRMTIRNLITTIPVTATDSITYNKEKVFTNNAAPVSENPAGLKPLSDITFELATVPVATIAHRIRCSNQILADVPRLAGYIDRKMRYGYRLKEEEQLLLGSGVGLNISGLITESTAYSNPGVSPSNETVIDRIRLAMLQVRISEYAADGVVLNPIDWTNIELQKDSQNRYLMANPFNLMTPVLWGLPVIDTNAMTADEFLVGAFGMGATIYDRETMNVALSTEDGDNFSQNMVTIRVEGRIALTVERSQAFVYGSFNDLTSG